MLTLPPLPVDINSPLGSKAAAVAVERDAVELVLCPECGHIFNSRFDAERVRYEPGYENALEHSRTFRSFADELARRLTDRYLHRGGSIVEIACGQGWFLERLCEISGSEGTGIDPATESPRGGTQRRFRILRDRWESWRRDIDADLVCCRHVLEHLHDPGDCLRTVAAYGGRSKNPVIYIEVPNTATMDSGVGVWDVVYEHVSYFRATSLFRLATTSGLVVLSMSEGYHGQYLCLEARAANTPAARLRHPHTVVDGASIAANCRKQLEYWNRRMADWARERFRVALWGAGSKGLTFLDLVGRHRRIDMVIDINPRKHGRFTAGSGYEIRPPETLGACRPDIVLISNPIYRDEIERTLNSQGLHPRLVSIMDPLPVR